MEEARMDRRTFVMGAAAIGAAALAGGVLGGCSDGEEAGTMTEPVPAAPSPTPEPAPGRCRTIPSSRRTSLWAAAWEPCRGASPGCATRRP